MIYILEEGKAVYFPNLNTIQNNNRHQVILRHAESLLFNCLLNGINEKREIIDHVWPNTIVTEGSYHKLIFELRKQLTEVGISQNQIKTIPRRGCTLTGEIQTLEDLRFDNIEDFDWSIINKSDNTEKKPSQNTLPDKLQNIKSQEKNTPKIAILSIKKRQLILPTVSFLIGGAISWAYDHTHKTIYHEKNEKGGKIIWISSKNKDTPYHEEPSLIYAYQSKNIESYYICKKTKKETVEPHCTNQIQLY
ncbi:winged helix-turn-helix domain-containing protein [Chromobacterium haemolyticum]|uniref:winged helix-turn-helix domain-containing protein n=1 Tax=Chromobacterium haemolyticum TaxID=394935 RepID=UPI0011301205|nr:hypothetical protein [Chromobacterium haemolyticum]